jgi:hypothetical protein
MGVERAVPCGPCNTTYKSRLTRAVRMADCFIYDEPGVPKVHDVTVFCFGGTFRKLLLLAGNFRYTTHFIGQFHYVAKATLLEAKQAIS